MSTVLRRTWRVRLPIASSVLLILMVSACASMEHAAVRHEQAIRLDRSAEHFNLAAADADRAASSLDRAAGTLLAIKGIDPEHVQNYSKYALILREVAHVIRGVADTLSSARLPLTRGQVRKIHEVGRASRDHLSDMLQATDMTRQLLPELIAAAQELSADDATTVAEAVDYIENAMDSVENMVTHADAAAAELERLE